MLLDFTIVFLDLNTMFNVKVTRRGKMLLDFFSNFNYRTNDLKSRSNMGNCLDT